jgi:uncharacterized protein YprB with RNaseH-like and TPR domain
MREIVIDTETTGLDPLSGHRVVEIGAAAQLRRAIVVHGRTARFCTAAAMLGCGGMRVGTRMR